MCNRSADTTKIFDEEQNKKQNAAESGRCRCVSNLIRFSDGIRVFTAAVSIIKSAKQTTTAVYSGAAEITLLTLIIESVALENKPKTVL